MGVWDDYCLVCGGPPYVVSYDMDTKEGEPYSPADFTWLDTSVGISNNEELIPLAADDSFGGFDTQPDMSPYTYFYLGSFDIYNFDEKTARGYACHITCYNLLQQELNYTLKYADVLPLLVDNVNNFSWSDYGGIAKYHDQHFDDEKLVKDRNLWMIADPSRNLQNKERILQLWRPLVESGFKRPDATVGDGSLAPETAKMNSDESKA